MFEISWKFSRKFAKNGYFLKKKIKFLNGLK